MVFNLEKTLGEVGDKIDANEKAAIEADLADIKSFLDSTKDQELSESQVAELKAKQEALMTKSQNLFTKMYENMQGTAGQQAGPDMGGFNAGPDMNAGAGNANDDVVDGDYREV